MTQTATDPFDLQRFVDAQAPVYARVLGELRAGRKQSHWIWYIFPQVRGLGRSATAIRYSIGSRDEAAAYIAHTLLGQRLRECTALLLAVEGHALAAIMPFPDDRKLVSSMTLFAEVAPDPAPFAAALEKYNCGARDEATLDILRALPA